jgi:hypothetical protein
MYTIPNLIFTVQRSLVFDRQGICQDGQKSHQEQKPGIGVYLDRSVLQRVTMSGGELHEAGLRKLQLVKTFFKKTTS